MCDNYVIKLNKNNLANNHKKNFVHRSTIITCNFFSQMFLDIGLIRIPRD